MIFCIMKTRGFVIKIYCSRCDVLLYVYRKAVPGHLVKCYVDCILKDYTKGDLKCLQCSQQFARLAKYRNRLAHKIIQGKIIIKGHYGK